MFDLDKWQEIIETMRKNKLRTFLTAFGVFWGIFMLVLLLGAGAGMQNGVKKDFENEAINSLWIWSDNTSIAYKGLQAGRKINYTVEDLEAISREVPEVSLVSARNRVFGEYTINYKDKNGSFQVFGTDQNFFFLNGEQVSAGRNLNLQDLKEQRKVIVMGEKARKVIFGEEKNKGLGEYVNVKGIFFKVVGFFTTSSNNGRNEERAYIPFSTYQNTFNGQKKVQLMGLVVKEGVKVSEIEPKIRKILSARHLVAPDDKKAIGLNNNEANYEQFTGLFTAIRLFVWVVGIGTLIAGIVGVSNIMMIIVKERTKEIGIRKAIGATPFSIVSLILQESIVITSLSGYLGLLAGTALLDLMRFAIEKFNLELPYFTRPEVDLGTAIAAILVLVFAGAFAGLMPALKAANIKPIEALNSD